MQLKAKTKKAAAPKPAAAAAAGAEKAKVVQPAVAEAKAKAKAAQVRVLMMHDAWGVSGGKDPWARGRHAGRSRQVACALRTAARACFAPLTLPPRYTTRHTRPFVAGGAQEGRQGGGPQDARRREARRQGADMSTQPVLSVVS